MNTPRTDAFEKQRIVEATTNDIATASWADFARQLECENENLREALKIAINTVECDSLDKDGHELPWHKIARKALAAQPEEKTK